MIQPDFISEIDFQNNQPVIFPDHLCPKTSHDDKLKFVVIMNHLDKLYFIARTNSLKIYTNNLAYFLTGSPRFCTSIELHRTRTDKNLPYWSVEVLDAATTNVTAIREKFAAPWRELGSKSHISRLGGADIVIYKVRHKATGWSRMGSYKVGKDPHPDYIAQQALMSLLDKFRRDKKTPADLRIALERVYREIYYDFERDPTTWEVIILETIGKDDERAGRPTDVVKELNVSNQAEWLGSSFVKNLVPAKK
jgi:hypothetical protein